MSNISGEVLSTAQAISAGINTAYYKGDTGARGATGATGARTYLHIKYAASATPNDAGISNTPNDYIGTCASTSATAPTTASSYTWARINSAAVQAAVEASASQAAASALTAAGHAASLGGLSFSVDSSDGGVNITY